MTRGPRTRPEDLASPMVMFLSALIFGYFGFTMRAVSTAPLFVTLLLWTLRISAVLFVVSALLTMLRPVIGNLLYALGGIVGAGLFVVVALMDIADTNNRALAWWLLLIFAAWNGYGSWLALRAILTRRTMPPAPGAAEVPGE